MICFIAAVLLSGTTAHQNPNPFLQTNWSWYCQGGNPQHTGIVQSASQSMSQILWSQTVDKRPTYSGNDLLTHYGSPVVSFKNSILFPIKFGVNGPFEVESVNGSTYQPNFFQKSNYILPPHDWIPMCGIALSLNMVGQSQYVFVPDAGGVVVERSADYFKSKPFPLYFMGASNYQANPAAYNSTVYIDTPITPGPNNCIYFGFTVTGSNPLGLKSGFARVAQDGTATYVYAQDVSGDSNITDVKQNCGPAVSNSGNSIYVVVNSGNFSAGYLLKLDATTLQLKAKVPLKDPNSGSSAYVDDDGTACPMVGPDGDVYIGVLENPWGSNHLRGWMLHYSGDLSQTKTPGAFGWDDTASVVPTSMVPSYSGTSSYLIATKYNNYVEGGGDGNNRIGVLDPNATEVDPVTGATVMNEVMTLSGPKHDPRFPNIPTAVYEWCVDTIAVDPGTDSLILNSEDGNMYRWNLGLNQITQSITLTGGIGEAYTPTVVGVNGTIYGMSNARLYAVGDPPSKPQVRHH